MQSEYRDRDEKNFTWYLIIVKLHCFYDHNRDLYENNLHCISSKQSIVLMRICDKGIQLEKLTIQWNIKWDFKMISTCQCFLFPIYPFSPPKWNHYWTSRRYYSWVDSINRNCLRTKRRKGKGVPLHFLLCLQRGREKEKERDRLRVEGWRDGVEIRMRSSVLVPLRHRSKMLCHNVMVYASRGCHWTCQAAKHILEKWWLNFYNNIMTRLTLDLKRVQQFGSSW